MSQFFSEVHELYINGLTNNGDLSSGLLHQVPLRAKIKSSVVDGKRAAFTNINYGAVQDGLDSGDVASLRGGVDRAAAGIKNRKATASQGLAGSDDIGAVARCDE